MSQETESPGNQRFLRYSSALVAIAVAFLWRSAMERHLGPVLPPYITFYPAVMVVATFAGLWPGVLATLLSALLADYWILPPQGSFRFERPSDAVGLVIFSLMGVLVSLLADGYRRNRRKAAAYDKELALRESEAQFRNLANAIPQLCWMADADGWIFWYNERWYEYTGTTPQQMEGWGWQSVHDPETLPKVLERWKGSIATGQPFDMVFPLRGADGVFHPFLTRVMPVRGTNSEVMRWFGTNTDISEQKQIEAELRKSQERLGLAVEVADLGEWELDLKDHAASRSLRHDQVFGYKSLLPEWTYEMFLDHVLPQHRVEIDEKFKASLASGIWDFETRIRRVDGEVRWIWARGRSWLDEIGQPARMLGTVMDITERKRAEEALRESKERLRVTLTSIGDGVMTADRYGRVTFLNPVAAALTGWQPEEAQGQPIQSVFHIINEQTRVTAEDIVVRVLQEGHVVELANHTALLARDGREIPVEDSAAPILDGEGNVIGVVLVFHDVTQKRHKEEQLRRLNRTLKALNNSNQALLHATEEAALLGQVCQIVTEDCGHAMVWMGFAEEDEGKSVRPVAYSGFEEGYLETLGITWADSERGRGPTGMAIRTGQPCSCRNMLTDPKFEPWRAEALKRGYASSLVLPLMEDDKAFGAITIYSQQPDAFSEDEVKLLLELTADLAYGVCTLRVRASRERAEEALRESEERHRLLAETMLQGVVHQDADGKIIAMNPAAERILGKTREEFLGSTSVREEHHTIREDGLPFPGLEHPAMVALRTGQPLHGVVMGVFNPRMSAYRWISVDAVPLCCPGESSPSQVYTVFEDITVRRKTEAELERHRHHLEELVQERTAELESANAQLQTTITEREQAQEAFRESANAFATLANHVPQFVWMCTPDGLNIYFNQRWVEYTGLTLEESYGRGWNTPFHPDDKQAAWDAWNHATGAGEKYYVESRLRAADGGYRWFLMLGEPLRNAQGSVVRWFGTCTDIEDLKRTEEELRRSEEARKVAEAVSAERQVLQTTLQRFYVVLSSMYSGILLVRDEGRVEFANQAFCDLFGLEDAPAGLVGLGPGDIIGKIKNNHLRPDEAVARIQEILDGGLAGKHPRIAEHH